MGDTRSSPQKLSTEKNFLEKSEIPHIPAVISRIIKMASDDKVSTEKLTSEIQKEPALVIKILKIVNAPFYGRRHKIGTITHAVTVLGMSAVQSIALSASILDRVFKNESISSFDLEDFWRHSFFSAIACQLMARKKKYLIPEEAFVVGLLHDIGVLAMLKAEPEKYKKIFIRENKSTRENIKTTLEESIFGTNHSRVGYLFAKQGDLPNIIYLPILYHHNPRACIEKSKKIRALTGIVYLSDILTSIFYSDKKADMLLKFKTMARKWAGFNEKESEDILYKISEEIDKTKDIFENISLDSQKSYAEILQEANAELGKINIRFNRVNRELEEREKEIKHINAEIKAEKERLSSELLLAKNIQLSMLPSPISTSYVDMDIHYEPMLGVGGDSAAVYVEDDERIYFSMLDVTGHGLGSALISMYLDAEITNLLAKKLSPLDIIENMNNFITDKFSDMGHYLTCFCGVLDGKKLLFAGAAHPPAILIRQYDVTLLKSQNTLIGLDNSLRKKKGMEELSLLPGDRLVIYTDGITERKNVNKKEFGISNLVDILKKNHSRPVKGLAEFIIREAEETSLEESESLAGQDDRMVMIFGIK